MKLEQFLIAEEGDDSRRLPDGRYASTYDRLGRCWNIGCGVTVGVTASTVWTADELEAHEAAELAGVVSGVRRLVKVPLGENRLTVLESFAYNVGLGALASSSILRSVNAGKFDAVPAELRLYVHAKGAVGPVPGLIKRRNDEIRLWQHPDDVPAPADLKTSKNVPQASKESPPMATATVSTAGVNVSTGSIISHLLGSFMSAAVAVGAPLLGVLQGTTWGHYIAGGLFGVAGAASLASNVWQMVTNNKNASNNTIAAISEAGNIAAQVLAAMQGFQMQANAPIAQPAAQPAAA